MTALNQRQIEDRVFWHRHYIDASNANVKNENQLTATLTNLLILAATAVMAASGTLLSSFLEDQSTYSGLLLAWGLFSASILFGVIQVLLERRSAQKARKKQNAIAQYCHESVKNQTTDSDFYNEVDRQKSEIKIDGPELPLWTQALLFFIGLVVLGYTLTNVLS